MAGNWLAHAAIVCWFPIVLVAFAATSIRRAIVAAAVSGFLFLPVTGLDTTGLKDKNSIISVGLLLGTVLFAPSRWVMLRPRLIDVPMVVWCLWPAVSATCNDHGAYEAAAAVLDHVLAWGIPYLIGRAFLADRAGVRALATGIFAGGVAYAPLCFWEVRMSPQLHRTFYGFHQHVFAQTYRAGGGYRPMIFMQHGLQVALWMVAASLAGLWLWRRAGLRALWGMPMGLLVPVVLTAAVLTQSAGALALLAIGVVVLFSTPPVARTILVVLALLPPAYIAARVTRAWSGAELVAASAAVTDGERVESLQFRLRNENLFVDRALEKPITGWGRFDGWFALDADGHAMSVPDGLWVIANGQNGLVGLGSLWLAMLFPAVRLALPKWSRHLARSAAAPVLAISVIALVFTIDCIFNAMINPIYIVGVGAIAALDPRALRKRRAARIHALPPGDEPRTVLTRAP